MRPVGRTLVCASLLASSLLFSGCLLVQPHDRPGPLDTLHTWLQQNSFYRLLSEDDLTERDLQCHTTPNQSSSCCCFSLLF